MYYRRWNNYRKYNSNKKYEENKNLMLPQRKSELNKLREKYGDKIEEPTLRDFGLNEESFKRINDFNKDIELKNTDIINKINNKRIKKKRAIKIIGLIIIIVVGTIIFLKTNSWTLFFIPLSLSVILHQILKNYQAYDSLTICFTKSSNDLLSYHKQSDAGEKYKQTLEDYRLFNELIKEEEKDREERSRREFWFSLDGRQFEIEIAKIFSILGCKTKLTQPTRDGGKDIIIIEERSKTIVECKAHKAPIGPKDVAALYGTMLHEKADRAILINLGGFSQRVKDFVEEKNIELWDIKEVLDLEKQSQNSTNRDKSAGYKFGILQGKFRRYEN